MFISGVYIIYPWACGQKCVGVDVYYEIGLLTYVQVYNIHVYNLYIHTEHTLI